MPSTISTLLDSHHVFHPKQMDAIGERQKPTFHRRILGGALVALSIPFTLGIGTVFLTYWAHRKVDHIEKENRSDLDQLVQKAFGERVADKAPSEQEVKFSAAVKGIKTGSSQSFMSAIQQLPESYDDYDYEADALMEAAIAHDNVPAAIALMNRYEGVEISLFDVKSGRMAKALIKLILSKFEDADEKKQFVKQVINGYSIFNKLIQSENANVEVVQALIDAGADYPKLREGSSPLQFVKKPEVAACLIDAYGIDALDQPNEEGNSPLFTVKDAEVLKLMIEKGFNLRNVDANGNTILHYFSSDRLKDHPELAELILSKIEDADVKKAFVNEANNNGFTALGYVQPLAVVKALVEAGAEGPQVNTWVHCEDPEIAGYLMDTFAEQINEKVAAGEMISPLLLVKNAEVLKVLIEKGLDVKAVHPDSGRTILHCVSEDWFNDDAELVTLILSKVNEAQRSDFVKLKAKLFDGEKAAKANALSFAKSVDVAKALIAGGIDPKELDTAGRNALFGNISASVARFLIEEHGVARDLKVHEGKEAIHYVGNDIEKAKVLMGDRRSDHDWGHDVERPKIFDNEDFAVWLAERETPADDDSESSDSD